VFRLLVRHNNAADEVNSLKLGSVEVHGVDTAPAAVTVNDSRWSHFSHSATTQVSVTVVKARQLEPTVAASWVRMLSPLTSAGSCYTVEPTIMAVASWKFAEEVLASPSGERRGPSLPIM